MATHYPLFTTHCSRVQVVAEGIADEVEGEDSQHDGEGGEDDHVGRVEEVGAGVVEHGAPACGWSGDAEAEEAESGFSEDGSGHADGALHDQRLQDVGEDVAGEDAKVGCAEGSGGFDELALADGHHLRPDEARVADPSGERQGKDEVEEAGAEEGYEGNCDEDARQREEGVRDVDVEDDVSDAAVEAGEASGDEAGGEGDGDDGDGDDQRDAGSVEGAGEDVAAELVGAEEVGACRGGHAVVEIEGGGVVRREERREDRGENEAEEQQDSGGGEGLAAGEMREDRDHSTVFQPMIQRMRRCLHLT